ncbi:YiiX/YebB-like N1pC/P60 family cysteine hydrolase [Caulobacter sp. RL271]|jgi:uncharacterized protein YycO|uniref:Peptidoglycan peptidase n=1 Tax=Caulobacter segnis TaxID=88688 RepID=A0ABY4ZN56_9CAUL|nr:YiiX/YebB-like N1pC/P60 family cysteine hydrolase [Caulobacter segnis]USQ94232.1 hypothetical protein MZV50_16675 [Caulobacter segnis]
MDRRSFVVGTLAGSTSAGQPDLQVGDVLFGAYPHSPWASLAAAFSLDRAPFGHVGLVAGLAPAQIVDANGDPTGGAVALRPIAEFLQGAQWVEVRRLRRSFVDRQRVARTAQAWIGAPFDSRILLDDDRLYCTELVWKAVKVACGLDLVPEKRRIGLRPVIDIGSLRASRELEFIWAGEPARLHIPRRAGR